MKFNAENLIESLQKLYRGPQSHNSQLFPISNISKTKHVRKLKKDNTNKFIWFYANWCPPCQQFSKTGVWDELKSENKNVTFYTIDCAEIKKVNEHFSVQGYPTFGFVNDSNKVIMYTKSTRKKEDLQKFISENI